MENYDNFGQLLNAQSNIKVDVPVFTNGKPTTEKDK